MANEDRGPRLQHEMKVVTHRHPLHAGVYIAQGFAHDLLTKIPVDEAPPAHDAEKRVYKWKNGMKNWYRVWDPYTSNLARAIICGIPSIGIARGSRVLYLGGDEIPDIYTRPHLSDIVGSCGSVSSSCPPGSEFDVIFADFANDPNNLRAHTLADCALSFSKPPGFFVTIINSSWTLAFMQSLRKRALKPSKAVSLEFDAVHGAAPDCVTGTVVNRGTVVKRVRFA